MIMSKFSVKENINVEGKSDNESGTQVESQKCASFTDFYSIYENNIQIKLLPYFF